MINKGEVILKLLITIVTAGRSGGRKRFERKSVARGYGRVRVFTSPAKSFPGVSLLGCYFSPVSRSVFDISFRLYIYIAKQNNLMIGSPADASRTLLWLAISTRREHLSSFYCILIGVRGQEIDMEFAWEAVSEWYYLYFDSLPLSLLNYKLVNVILYNELNSFLFWNY